MIECPIYGLTDDAGNLPASFVSDSQDINIVKPYDISFIDGTTTTLIPSDIHHTYSRMRNDSDFDSEAVIVGPNLRKAFVNPTVKLRTKPDEVDTSHIPFDNVVDVDEEDIQYIKDSATTHTQKLMEVLFKQHAPLAMAAEVAQAQIEAIFRDCFDTEIESDLDFENQLEFITQLDTFCYLLDTQKNIPKAMREMVIEKTVEKLIVDWTTNTTRSYKAETNRRYRSELENASARVKAKETSGDRSNIAVRGSRTRG